MAALEPRLRAAGGQEQQSIPVPAGTPHDRRTVRRMRSVSAGPSWRINRHHTCLPTTACVYPPIPGATDLSSCISEADRFLWASLGGLWQFVHLSYLFIIKPFLMLSIRHAEVWSERIYLSTPQSSNKEEYYKEYLRVRHWQKEGYNRDMI